MNVQISEIKLIGLFIEVDDICNGYLQYRKSIGKAHQGHGAYGA